MLKQLEAILFNHPRCPWCNKRFLDGDDCFTLNNGTEIHSMCWPFYFAQEVSTILSKAKDLELISSGKVTKH